MRRLAPAVLIAALGVAQAQQTTDVVKIAYAGPLSGPVAHVGKDAENGVRLAIEEANAAGVAIGGKKARFELVSMDDQGDPRTAVSVAQRLVDAEVNGVVGHITSGATIPASKVYSQAGIPQISPSATNPTFTRQGYETAFRVIGDDAVVGRVIAQYMSKDLKGKSVAIIDDQTAYGQGLADVVEKEAKQIGMQVVAREAVTDKAVDFKSVLTKIRGKQPDLIFYGGVDAQGGPLRRQMASLAMKQRLVGSAIETENFLKLAGPSAEGTVSAGSGIPIESMPKGRDFVERYKKFGAIVLFAPYAYDATWALITAMKDAGSAKPSAYLPALKKLQMQGVTGQISFDSKGDLRAAGVTLYEAKSGKFVPVSVITGTDGARK
ncbi:branched-chain amino acid ABC transporter substrate-binding protein (plasmid) [Cupriavidus basilensis]